MKFLKYSLLIISSLTVFSSTLYAEDDVISLPTITVMAEEELRDEFVGILPYQEDEEVKEALRYQVYKLESDIQNKEINEMLSKLEIGSEVIAASGIIGKVKAIKGEYISLEVSENVVFKLQRSAIANILPKGTIESIK